MSNIILDYKINKFMKKKQSEMPELKRNSVDRMIEDLAAEARAGRSF